MLWDNSWVYVQFEVFDFMDKIETFLPAMSWSPERLSTNEFNKTNSSGGQSEIVCFIQ